MDDNKKEQELITIAGGVEMEVAFQKNGDKETVKVRHIPLSKMSLFIAVMSDESRSIELYCDKPQGWADTLKLQSAYDVLEKGQELNLPFFGRWFAIATRWRGKPATRQHDYRHERKRDKPTISVGQLAVSVAYHYHLTPQQVAQFSGQQILLWHERVGVELGYEKLLELDVSLVPHTKEPAEALEAVREQLIKMTERGQNGRR